MPKFATVAAVLCLAFLAMTGGTAGSETPKVEQQERLSEAEIAEAGAILERLVADYRADPMAIDGLFGIRLADQYWAVEIARRETASKRGRLTDHAFGPHEVTL